MGLAHIFITPKHFDKCREWGLFGVREGSVNQLANVHARDTVFMYDKKKQQIVGPYIATSELFYNPQVIWEQSSDGRDEFPYRVKLDSIDFCGAVPIDEISELVNQGKLRIDSGDLAGKSVHTILPGEDELIKAKLQSNLNESCRIRDPKSVGLDEKPFDIRPFVKNGIVLEKALETYLLQNPNELERIIGSKLRVLYNQFRTNLGGERIDILAFTNTAIFTFELKKGTLKRGDYEKLKEKYWAWTDKNSKWLSERFLCYAPPRVMETYGILLGKSNAIGELGTQDDQLKIVTYDVSGDRIIFSTQN